MELEDTREGTRWKTATCVRFSLSGRTASSPLLEDISIAIVGAGIGGLSLALALRHQGFQNVIVHEQNAQGWRGETGDQVIELTANGSRVLHALGLEKQLTDASSIPGFAYLRTRQSGFLLIQRPLGDFSEARYGAPTYVILYSKLVEVLHDACVERGVHLHYDTRITDLETETGELTTESGTTENHSAVVVADGAAGSLHQIVCAQPVPPASTIHSIRATSHGPSALNAVVTWLAADGFCIQYPTDAEQTDLLFVYLADTTGDGSERAEDLLKNALADSHHHLSDALQGVQTASYVESGCPRVAEFWHAGKARCWAMPATRCQAMNLKAPMRGDRRRLGAGRDDGALGRSATRGIFRLSAISPPTNAKTVVGTLLKPCRAAG